MPINYEINDVELLKMTFVEKESNFYESITDVKSMSILHTDVKSMTILSIEMVLWVPPHLF